MNEREIVKKYFNEMEGCFIFKYSKVGTFRFSIKYKTLQRYRCTGLTGSWVKSTGKEYSEMLQCRKRLSGYFI